MGIEVTIDQFLKNSYAPVTNSSFNDAQKRGKRIQEDFITIIKKIGTEATDIEQLKADLLALQNEVDNLVATIPADIIIDYDVNITGIKNGVNRTFSPQFSFLTNTTQVWLAGLRRTPGITNDYIENTNNSITFNYDVYPSDMIVIAYKKLNTST